MTFCHSDRGWKAEIERKYNKPENPFQNYNLAKKLLEVLNKLFYIKISLEVQKPETVQKTGPRTTGQILCKINQYVKRTFAYIKIFSIRPSEVQKPETRQKF